LALLLIGEKGCGKTRTIEAVQQMSNRDVLVADYKTLYSLASFSEDDKGRKDIFSGRKVLWLSRDLARVTYESLVNTLKLVCALITEHGVSGSTMMYDIDIKEAYCSWIGATTCEIFNMLWYSPLWRGNFMDRIFRFYMFPYARKKINPSPTKCTPRPIGTATLGEIKAKDEYVDEIAKLLEMQFTYERSYEYAERLLKACAKVNGRTQVTESDVAFLKLFEFNFMLEKLAGYRPALSAPLELDIDSIVLFSEVLKRKQVTFSEIQYLYSCPISQWKHLTENSMLFEVDGETIKPNQSLYEKYIQPLIAFEEACLFGKLEAITWLKDTY
jgi:hypothetical protein